MAAQQVFVVPVAGLWVFKVGDQTSASYLLQSEAIDAARDWLLSNGGGELVVLGEDGRIRQKDTIGRPDPRDSRG
ncbi:hypothetical protein AUC47_10270 [Microbacterium sp. SZ1]|uniref:DUF2188 domain-containing protein n=1 Tax=Microbacterium sp. SZ1 TaxID=1849736 RepID=UPI000BBC040C|nr:DUF2188 domain-containing protein [Microbacterium sp. SZ1]PCE15902.1 hypothetical protein AUC47_10270 [Microbacterium sp. SZ1]